MATYEEIQKQIDAIMREKKILEAQLDLIVKKLRQLIQK